MLVGYMRCSTADQNLDLQRDALEKAGCERIFKDNGVSGATTERPGLAEALACVREGDVLVVWKLDRLGRSLRHLIEVVHGLEARRVQVRSLTEGFDTTTAAGKMLFHVIGALAEMERSIIRERTHAGLAAARARGRNGGRKRNLDSRAVKMARAMLADRDVSVEEVASTMRVNRATLYRALKRPVSC
jgi:DNA invertase Pin-like site-specific DNA recombinase